MLLAILLSACTEGGPEDTGRLPISNETDSASGTYHLEARFTPDPPVAGDQDLELVMTWNAEDDLIDGALVAGATLTATLTAPDARDAPALHPAFVETSLGSYEASFTWSAAGYWVLTLGIGDLDQDGSALMAFEVATP